MASVGLRLSPVTGEEKSFNMANNGAISLMLRNSMTAAKVSYFPSQFPMFVDPHAYDKRTYCIREKAVNPPVFSPRQRERFVHPGGCAKRVLAQGRYPGA